MFKGLIGNFKSTIILVSLMPLLCLGQNSTQAKNNSWCLRAGYQHIRLLDKNVSPLLYAANNLALEGEFVSIKKENRLQITLSASVGSNQSQLHGKREAIVYSHYSINGQLDSSLYVINPFLSYLQIGSSFTYLHKFGETRQAGYIGGKVLYNFQYSGMGADTWFFSQLSLMPVCRIEVKKGSLLGLNGEIAMPIISYLVRQPYTLDPSLPLDSYLKAYMKTGAKLTWLKEFEQLNIAINYQYQLNEKRSLGLSYKFMVMKYTNLKDHNLQAYSNTLFLSYSF